MHVHDGKPCVMMESIKNVAVSDLVPSFLLKISPLFLSNNILLYMSMDRQCETMQSVQEIFRACNACTISPTTKCGAFWKFLCMRHTCHAQPTLLGLIRALSLVQCIY